MSEPARLFPPGDEHGDDMAASRGGRPRPGTEGMGRLLIADDTPDARELYSLYFRNLGYYVLTANDGPTALTYARDLAPDLIVMDLAMPGMSGATAIRQLKEDPGTRDIKIILLTGHRLWAVEQGALELGADIFLTKPCLPEDLAAHVERLLARRI